MPCQSDKWSSPASQETDYFSGNLRCLRLSKFFLEKLQCSTCFGTNSPGAVVDTSSDIGAGPPTGVISFTLDPPRHCGMVPFCTFGGSYVHVLMSSKLLHKPDTRAFCKVKASLSHKSNYRSVLFR